MNTAECRRCGRRVRDDAYACDDCAGLLFAELGEVAWLDVQLDVSLSRQRGIDLRSGGGDSSGGLGFTEQAGKARRELHSKLVEWVRWCDAEQVRNSSPQRGLPADRLPHLATWLRWRVDGLALHETGPDAITEITGAIAYARRVVMFKPPSKVYLGPCDVRFPDHGFARCIGSVYALEGEELGQCNACRMPYVAETKRAELEAALDDRLCTAAEIAHLSTYLGLNVSREQVRKRVLYWQRHGRIIAVPSRADGPPKFRYGAVRSMLYREYATADSRQ